MRGQGPLPRISRPRVLTAGLEVEGSVPEVELARRPGVELVRTGNWATMSGSWNPTPDDLASAVDAQSCPAIEKPIIKLGHVDKRFDGEPAMGWFENLRTADGGHTLIGDQVLLPWLHSVQAAAYPSRSIEGNYNHTCAAGHRHKFVLTAVALLGVTPPAVKTIRRLNDLPAMLGVAAAQVPEGAEPVQVTVLAGRAVFDESKHKRDGDGQFATKSGSDSDSGGRSPAPSGPLTGKAALDAPPLKLADMDRSSPRAEALWFRTGDNSLETRDYPGFVRLNEHLREGGHDTKMAAYAEEIDAAMAESKLPAPIRVLRGIQASAIGTPGQLEGVEFVDRAFTSTTVDDKHAEAFGSTMSITVPAGVSAIRMADRDPDLPESEILLDRGLRYRVVKEVLEMDGRDLKRHHLEVEVVPDGPVKASGSARREPAGKSPGDLFRAKYVWAEGDVEVVDRKVKAAADVHTGAMVALIPTAADAERLAVKGGEPAEQLHVTLAYLGEAADLGARGRQDVTDHVSTVVNGLPRIEADIFAVSVFNPGPDTERDTCLVWGVTGDILDAVHDLIGETLHLVDAPLPAQHRPWNAHVTAAYTGDLGRIGELAAKTGPVVFDRIRLAFGGEFVDIPLMEWPGEEAEPVAASSPIDAAYERLAGLRTRIAAPAAVEASETPAPGQPPAPTLPAAEPEPVTTTEEDPVSLSDNMRSRLGLADDADETAALAAIDALKTAAEKTPEPTPEMVAASAAATEKADKAEQAQALMREELTKVRDELNTIKASAAQTVKASAFSGWLATGRLKPADRETWEARYDRDPEMVTEILSGRGENSEVPVMASGTTGAPESAGATPEMSDEDFNRLFGITQEA